MSEQQHPFLEHERALEDPAKLPLIKPQNTGSNAHLRASTPVTPQEEQVSVLQPVSNPLSSINEIHDPAIDESFAPSHKFPVLKNGQSPLSERHTALVLSSLEQEQPVAGAVFSSIPRAQQLYRAATIADDYDFSEADVDLVDMISYGLFQPDSKLSKEEQEILTNNAAASLSPADETMSLTSTTSSSLVEETPPLIETEVSAPTEEEISTTDSEVQIPVDEEMPAAAIVSYDEEEIASSSINEASGGNRCIVPAGPDTTNLEVDGSEGVINQAPTEDDGVPLSDTNDIAVEAQLIASSTPDTTDVEAPIDVETAEVADDVQTNTENQLLPLEEEVSSSTSDVSPSIEQDTREQDTGEEAQNTIDDTAAVSTEQEPESPVTSSSSLLEESTLVHEESKQEEAPTEEPSPETTDTALTADTAFEEVLPVTTVDTPPTLLEEHVETEQEADDTKIADEQPIALEALMRIVEAEHVTGEEELASEQALTVETLPDLQDPIEELADEQPLEVEVPSDTKEAGEARVDEQWAVVEEVSGVKAFLEEVADVAKAQSVAVEEVPGANYSTRESVDTSAPVETEIDTENVGVEPTSVEATPVSATPKRPTSETQVIVRQRKKYRLSRREIANLVLLVLFAVSTILLWRDLTATHVYLTALNPNNGKVLTQQDLGGYQDSVTLTAPISESSQVYVGIHGNDPQGTQQIMALSGNTNSWYMTAKFAAPLARGTLSGTADGHLFAVGTNGLQVMTANGHVLWSLQGEQPSRGTHHYQPISDSQTLYAVASLKQSQVAAYDLQHGTRRWVQTLDDTLNDTPPLLLDENTLYIAGDHNLYALNSSDGSLRWEKVYPSRTLLMENEGETQLLLAAGAQGLTAFSPATGALVWSFNGQPDDTFTTAQFYQAAIASTDETNSNVVYATGIVWQMPQAQQQVWLYAVNAATGTLRWSQQVDAGFVSADAGRTLLPLIDTTQGTVVLQQQIDNHKQRITAFDSNTGASRWSTFMANITGASPTLAQTPNGTLILFTTVANSRKVLFTPSLLRLIEIIIFALLLIGVLFSAMDWLRMGFFYLQSYSKQFRHILRILQRYTHFLFQRFVLLSPLVRMLIILLLLSILGGAGTLGYTRLNQFQNTLYQVNVSNGAIQWQQRMTASAHAFTTDAEGSVIATSGGDHLHQLQALTPDGTVRWKTFPSQGIFSAAAVASSPGTIVVELRGDTASTYQFAPADDAYPDTIDHLLVLYVLNRSTGAPLWQHVLVYPDQQQHAVILGADNNYIYVSSTQTHPVSESKGATLQLFAVNRATGTIDWRVFGPAEPNSDPHDDGQLLLRGGQAIWQAAGTIYAIDTVVGQIEWRRQIADDDLSVLAREDQMTEAAGALLVIRRHGVHALDLNTGNELWTLPSKGVSTPQSAAGVSVVGQTILVYGNGQIEAFDLWDHHSLWRNVQFDAIQHLSVSDDGKTVYMIEVSNLAGSSPALVALDAQTGTTQWTFEPASQATFPFASPDSFLSNANMLFITTCFPFGQDACAHQRLYALATETGKPAWTFVGHRISDLHLSQDGKTLLFSVNTSLWSDLVAHL